MNQTIMGKIFPEEMDRISKSKCPFCSEIVNPISFRDTLSRTEYGISGLCQKCQDETFGGGPQ